MHAGLSGQHHPSFTVKLTARQLPPIPMLHLQTALRQTPKLVNVKNGARRINADNNEQSIICSSYSKAYQRMLRILSL